MPSVAGAPRTSSSLANKVTAPVHAAAKAHAPTRSHRAERRAAAVIAAAPITPSPTDPGQGRPAHAPMRIAPAVKRAGSGIARAAKPNEMAGQDLLNL